MYSLLMEITDAIQRETKQAVKAHLGFLVESEDTRALVPGTNGEVCARMTAATALSNDDGHLSPGEKTVSTRLDVLRRVSVPVAVFETPNRVAECCAAGRPGSYTTYTAAPRARHMRHTSCPRERYIDGEQHSTYKGCDHDPRPSMTRSDRPERRRPSRQSSNHL